MDIETTPFIKNEIKNKEVNKAVIDLSDYVEMVVEYERKSAKLDVALAVCRKKITKEMRDDCISVYSIHCLPEEECEKCLAADDDYLINRFSYMSDLKELFAEYACFERGEISFMAAGIIRDEIRKKLNAIKEKEQEE